MIVDLNTLDPIVAGWITQLVHPQMKQILEAANGARIDVTMSAANHKIRKSPEIKINAGTIEFTHP
jgi:hypothetical protein